jgi:hypothetical protein
MNKIILTDSCFWLGLIDSGDQHHGDSVAVAGLIDNYQIVIPWPCLYETVSTHLVRRRSQLILLEKLISKPNIVLFDDSGYKEEALEEILLLNRLSGYSYSLTDGVIREILKDINIKIDYFVTFNNADFADVCAKREIEIIG